MIFSYGDSLTYPSDHSDAYIFRWAGMGVFLSKDVRDTYLTACWIRHQIHESNISEDEY